MLGIVFGFLKNYKSIASILGILVAVGSLYGVYSNVKDGWYEQGVIDTERQYQTKLVEMQQEYTVKLEQELANYRISMNANFAKELERVRAERIVETEVTEVISYVDREIKISAECDVVPLDFSRLLNNSINKVNGSTTPY
jgi:hypothetical protein